MQEVITNEGELLAFCNRLAPAMVSMNKQKVVAVATSSKTTACLRDYTQVNSSGLPFPFSSTVPLATSPHPPFDPSYLVSLLPLRGWRDKGIFVSQRCGDGKDRVQSTKHGPKQYEPTDTWLNGQLR